jgi:hypothetical protein
VLFGLVSLYKIIGLGLTFLGMAFFSSFFGGKEGSSKKSKAICESAIS